jgi:hypothetical protein
VKDQGGDGQLRQDLRKMRQHLSGLAPTQNPHEIPSAAKSGKGLSEVAAAGKRGPFFVLHGPPHGEVPEERMNQRRQTLAKHWLPQPLEKKIGLEVGKQGRRKQRQTADVWLKRVGVLCRNG